VLAKPVLIKRVERTNTTMVNLNQEAEFVLRHNLYAIEIDCERTTIVVGDLNIWLGIVEIEQLVDKKVGLSMETIQTM